MFITSFFQSIYSILLLKLGFGSDCIYSLNTCDSYLPFAVIIATISENQMNFVKIYFTIFGNLQTSQTTRADDNITFLSIFYGSGSEYFTRLIDFVMN